MSHGQLHSQWTETLRASTATVTDLLSIVAYVAVADVVFIDGTLSNGIQALLGLPLLLFVPGYLVLAALFPRRRAAVRSGLTDRPFATISEGALEPLERLALSFGVSVAALPPIALGMSALELGFRSVTVTATMTGLLLAGAVVAGARRFRLPEEERFTVSPTAWLSRQSAAFGELSLASGVLTAILLVLALAATSALAYGLVAPGGGDTYTNVGLFTENETGALVTSGYPTTVAAGETGEVAVVVENHEGRAVNYTLVAQLQRVTRANDAVTVEESVELDRTRRSLQDGERWRSNQTISPELTGTDLRVAYLVYRGTPPEEPGVDNADQSVYLSIDIEG